VGLKCLVAAALTILVLAGCGARPCQECAALGSPQPIPAAGFDLLITNHDQDVTVRTGQQIEVYLTQRSGLTPWTGLRSADEAVLAPMATGITAPRGVTIGGFKAVAPGTASITAYATAACSPGQACPMFAALFSVKVTVV
jgi:hypothetical protein